MIVETIGDVEKYDKSDHASRSIHCVMLFLVRETNTNYSIFTLERVHVSD